MKSKRRHRVATNIALSVLGLLLLVGPVEGVLRLAGYRYRPLSIRMENLGDTDWRGFHAFGDSQFVFDPLLIWRPVKGQSVFNAEGFRGRDLSLAPDSGIQRIFTLGDSNTLGPADLPGWPEYLQLHFERRGGVEIINAGVIGYSSFQGLRLLEMILRYSPRIVLVSFGANDAHHVLLSDEEYLDRVAETYDWCREFRLCELLVAARDRVRLALEAHGETRLVPRVSTMHYARILNEMIDLARRNRIQVLFLTRPYVGESHHPLWWKNFASQYNEIVIQIARERGVPYLDVYQSFEDRMDLFADESHFNDAGYRQMARLVYEFLLAFSP